MENIEETIDLSDKQNDGLPEENVTINEKADFAGQFARWLDNPLVSIAIAEPRLCRFIGDLLAGEDTECAVKRNFPQVPPLMPDGIAKEYGMDEATARQVADCGLEIMKGDWSERAVKILLQAVNHDSDMKEAEETGYLRGRNSAIEAHMRQRTTKFRPIN